MRDRKGFTLIEIAVVVFLAGLFLLITIPKFQDITEVNIKSASRRLSGTIKYIYNEAAFKKKVYRLAFDIENGEYWVEILEGNEFVIPGDPSFRRRKLPTGVYFKDIVTERTREKLVEGDEEFILFTPAGFVEPAVIHLETETGSAYTIATKPYTGGTIVYDEYVELLQK
ncbi:MAG TPA: prepilin-type N-terminal cleavage/methylation domain-containing protein [Thermodesulfobacteriota bacterium]|nr:prepilin-type N-terminal cleavage/methylation domain-containing protein [Thermodesulfobacteriota bacterium]